MNQEKIGKFISELRKENGMTQDDLAEKIPISRQAISKWERGKSIPNSDILLILSDLFKVSVNEILLGERFNSSNKFNADQVTVKLYDNMTRKKKIIKCMGGLLIILVIVFFIYYFINSYKKVKIYTIVGESENYVLTDGIFIKTNEKLYLRLGNIDTINNYKIKRLNLYYIDNDKSKKILMNTSEDFIKIVDINGYDSFFDFKKIDYIINNMILEIENDNGEIQAMKLKFIEDYINDIKTLLSKKTYYDDNNLEKNEAVFNDDTYLPLEQKILEKFDKVDDGYTYAIKNSEYEYDFYYDETMHLNITTIMDGKILEELDSILNTNYSSYINYVENINFEINNREINCLEGECSNYKVIMKKYEKLINNILT